jgi:hypothetical protein
MEPAPPKSHLGHIIGAVVVVVMGGVRVLDDCGRAGLRIGRSADEVAGAGAGFGSRSADELAGGARFAQGSDPLATGRWADDLPHASTTESNDVLEAVVEGSVEVGLEVMDVPLDDVDSGGDADGDGVDDYAPPDTRPVALTVACPARIDLGAEPERWQRFVDTGFGAACAPNLVFGRAVPGSPDTLVWGAAQRSVQQLATDCWNAGSTCIIVACDDDCAEGIGAIRHGVRDMDAGLEPYTALLTSAVLALDPKPRVVAVVRGDRAPQMQMVVR